VQQVNKGGDFLPASKQRIRVELRLPEDHPLLSYPVGQRAVVAREWMDIGLQLYQINQKLDVLSGQVIVAGQETHHVEPLKPPALKQELPQKKGANLAKALLAFDS
jgi:hypothetical protein